LAALPAALVAAAQRSAAPDPQGRRVFVASDQGSILQIHGPSKELQVIYKVHNGPITSILVNESFCVTGAEDSYVRVWPLDFSDYFLEARLVLRDDHRARPLPQPQIPPGHGDRVTVVWGVWWNKDQRSAGRGKERAWRSRGGHTHRTE
jgi:hypothetical protein